MEKGLPEGEAESTKKEAALRRAGGYGGGVKFPKCSSAEIVLLAGLVFLLGTARGAEPIALWPGEAPGEHGEVGVEGDSSKPGEGLVAGRTVIRLANVSHPTLTVYPAPAEKNTGAAVVICPGGGYSILAWDLEGTEVCEWLNSIGVTGVLLKYRVPARPDQPPYLAPLQDAQRALSLTRERAKKWGVDPARIGILGFSAGGHLAAAASCRFNQRAYEAVDATDKASCRPDFALLIYPAYLTSPKDNDRISPELTITSNTPPTFLVQTEDDPIRPENIMFYALALKRAHVAVEAHLFPKGRHGYGLRPSTNEVTTWPRLAEQWMRAGGWLQANL